MAPKDYDFCGWVTKNDLKCSDGRTIHQDAFAHQDGAKVPLVWNHNHDSVSEVLGYTILENRPEGVYGYSFCNDTEKGQTAKMLVSHGDIDSYSIFANHLKQVGSTVHHGDIKEVSLVFSPANPGAFIENVALAHGEDVEEDCANIYTGEPLELYHADEDDKTEETSESDDETVGKVLMTLNDKQRKAVAYMLASVVSESGDQTEEELEVKHSDDEDVESEEESETTEEVEEESSEETIEEESEDEETIEHSDFNEGEEDMKKNVFDSQTGTSYLSHSDLNAILDEAKDTGSFMKVYKSYITELSHADDDSGIDYSEDVQDYFVNQPDFLFPEAKSLNNPPDWIKRDTDWVDVVINGTKRTGFSRIKSVFADITADEARAKGYIKGNRKENEVFTLLKRKTGPHTLYKKQEIDRDDLLDITDFAVIPWLWSEMVIMIKEELARDILIGDGRLTASPDHMPEENVRPIWTDDPLFTIRKTVAKEAGEEGAVKMAKAFIKTAIKARKDYKGSGNPILFTTEDWLTEMLLLEDGIGHALYETENALATKMRVSKIVTVPVMENQSRDGKDLMGIIVNLSDYNVGSDRGGELTRFEDFDIDFNKQKLLIETRVSGALVKPYSAIVIEAGTANPSQG